MIDNRPNTIITAPDIIVIRYVSDTLIVPAKIYNIPRPQTNRKMLKLRVTMFRMCARALSGFGSRNRPSNTKMKSDIMTTQTDMTIDFGSHASGYNTTATIDVTISASAPKTFTGQKKSMLETNQIAYKNRINNDLQAKRY